MSNSRNIFLSCLLRNFTGNSVFSFSDKKINFLKIQALNNYVTLHNLFFPTPPPKVHGNNLMYTFATSMYRRGGAGWGTGATASREYKANNHLIIIWAYTRAVRYSTCSLLKCYLVILNSKLL